MITVLLKALARGKLTALAVVATLILVTASVAVANNPPVGIDSSTTNVDEFNADQQPDAANSSQLLSEAIYTKQLTSTGRNLVEGDDREDDGRQVAAVACDEGDIVLSGGHYKVDKGTTLVASGPSPHHNKWKLVWIDDKTEDAIGVKVLCADMGTQHTVAAPEAAVPEAAAEATTPEASSPASTTPEASSPEASASGTASPEATSDPAAISPEAAAAEGTIPDASATATASPEASASAEASVPEATASEVVP